MYTRFLLLILFVGFASARIDDFPEPQERTGTPEFTFLRLVYSGHDWSGSSWAIDYPKADQQFLYGLRKLTDFGFVNTEHQPFSSPTLKCSITLFYMRLKWEP